MYGGLNNNCDPITICKYKIDIINNIANKCLLQFYFLLAQSRILLKLCVIIYNNFFVVFNSMFTFNFQIFFNYFKLHMH